MNLSFVFYNLVVVPFMYLAFRLLALFKPKIQRGIRGRKNLFSRLEEKIQVFGERKRILIHAASMGEFEQARPVLRELRNHFPEHILCVSVFSPSAFENVHNHPEADIVTYLPFDSLRACRKFLNIIRPQALLFTRYDLWPNLIWEAWRRKIQILLFDASVQETSLRHKPLVRQFNRAIFNTLNAICVISQDAAENIQKNFAPQTPVFVIGDTRFDQVVFRAKEKPLTTIVAEPVTKWRQTIVAGSTWPEDEEIILPAFARIVQLQPGAKLILVPHEPSEEHLHKSETECRQLSLKSQRMSNFDENKEADIMIVDRIGVLANLYAAGQAAFIGGSFGPGVHNVLEAAAHAIPVFFGPKMLNSPEALDMVEQGCGFIVNTSDEVVELLANWFGKQNEWQHLADKAAQFVTIRTGASKKIIKILKERILPNQS